MVQSKILLENDRVKVVEIHVAPGEKMPMHTHGKYIAYTMNTAKVKFILPDGTTREQELDKGTVRYSDGVTHSLEKYWLFRNFQSGYRAERSLESLEHLEEHQNRDRASHDEESDRNQPPEELSPFHNLGSTAFLLPRILLT
jgi:hypothetical protein